jgi:serine/threonine protein phosphatase PrpC
MDEFGLTEQPTLVASPLGCVVACSRSGAAHRRAGKPCQDAYALQVIGEASAPGLALAVADGHGDERHDFSQVGAALAVRLAVEEMARCYRYYGAPGSRTALKHAFRADVPRRLGRAWRHAVLEDARKRLSADVGNEEDLQRLSSRYGTTLLTALVLPHAVLLGQIGDGDFLSISHGGAVFVPLPGDDASVGPQTASLSSVQAMYLWRTTWLEIGPGDNLLLATDGLSNAFADDSQFHTFARSLVSRLHEFGPEAVAAAVPQWLDHYSAQGSGDDITLVFAALSAGEHP